MIQGAAHAVIFDGTGAFNRTVATFVRGLEIERIVP
jgi:hypothetical protein